MKTDYVAPTLKLDAFHCPHCESYAHQTWFRAVLTEVSPFNPDAITKYRDLIENLEISICSKCTNYSIWINEKMVYPDLSTAPSPVEDMPEDVKNDFLEAREIVNKSPRAAAALLRLALEKLVTDHLEAEGSNINQRIGDLVKKGLPSQIQKALDSVRVIGNEAVHPGQMDLKDDTETSIALFKLLNFIVEKTITESKEIDQIYNILPENKKEGIINRDKAK